MSSNPLDVDPLVLVEHVRDIDARVAIVTLNRPEAMNPLDSATISELSSTLSSLIGKRDLRAIIITGAGDAFSAGGDLKGYRTLFQDAEALRRLPRRLCGDLPAARAIAGPHGGHGERHVRRGRPRAGARVRPRDDRRRGAHRRRPPAVRAAAGCGLEPAPREGHRLPAARHWLLSGDLFAVDGRRGRVGDSRRRAFVATRVHARSRPRGSADTVRPRWAG